MLDFIVKMTSRPCFATQSVVLGYYAKLGRLFRQNVHHYAFDSYICVFVSIIFYFKWLFLCFEVGR